MLSSTPDYITSHIRDRTPIGESLDRARHGHDLAARHGSARRAKFTQYVVAMYHPLIRT
jgi:hypothetical protein